MEEINEMLSKKLVNQSRKTVLTITKLELSPTGCCPEGSITYDRQLDIEIIERGGESYSKALDSDQIQEVLKLIYPDSG